MSPAAHQLHYNGNDMNPDLFFVSFDINDISTSKVIEGPGSGHTQPGKLLKHNILQSNAKPSC